MPDREYPDGYPSLAAFMASDLDRTALIFKRFDRLTARTLLCLETGMAELQAQLDAFDEEDRGSPCARNWTTYKEKWQVYPQRAKLLEDIQKTIIEYKRLLSYESVLASQPTPDRRMLKAFCLGFYHGPPRAEDSFPILGGKSSSLYDDIDDLMILRPPVRSDRLSTFLRNFLGFIFVKKLPKGRPNISGLGYASESRIETFVLYLSTVLAALLLIGAIIVLYKVPSPDLKLGLVGLFTVLFAGSVGLLTNARVAEIFGATAAYAAVLVVFISGEIGGSKTS
ncbi:unnamed protein product [Clonostachys byssicola]|uniref:DUF6594 domain-containing protein n=1 Tax=Clonostachys byssicola TaxID=160290 RepID=A0A9N9XWT8_9HYPO|nr:unnamed protein product [Clonostachys byssicola]